MRAFQEDGIVVGDTILGWKIKLVFYTLMRYSF
jgi:hypothetical protein